MEYGYRYRSPEWAVVATVKHNTEKEAWEELKKHLKKPTEWTYAGRVS